MARPADKSGQGSTLGARRCAAGLAEFPADWDQIDQRSSCSQLHKSDRLEHLNENKMKNACSNDG
jgi:hypothetical protein